MATQKNENELLNAFADNTDRAIKEADLRDFVVSAVLRDNGSDLTVAVFTDKVRGGVVNAGHPDFSGSTSAERVDAAIQFAKTEGHPFVQVPESEIPYNPANMPNGFVDGVVMIRESNVTAAVDAKAYGAAGDWDGSSGTDDTASIQAAIDAAAYRTSPKLKEVFLPAGRYKTTDTLHLGYGTGFKTVTLRGAGQRFRGEAQFGGTAIFPQFSDRPCVNFQGGRRSRLKSLSLIGQNFLHIKNADILKGPEDWDSDVRSNWIDSSLAATADSRYAPYAGVTIDAYSGSEPATSYPDVDYPSWLGSPGQYNKGFSEGTLLDDVQISGFVVGVCTQPSGASGNGDYTTVRDSAIQHNVVNFHVSHTQSREVNLHNVKLTDAYTALSNSDYGQQTGKYGGTIDGCGFDRVVYLWRGTDHWRGPMTVRGCYGELMRRLHKVEGTSTDAMPFTYEGCEFRFHDESEGKTPKRHVINKASPAAPVIFDGCQINVPRVFAYDRPVEFRGGTRVTANGVVGGGSGTMTGSEARRLAVNGSIGIFPSLSAVNEPYGEVTNLRARHFPDVTSAGENELQVDLHKLFQSGQAYEGVPSGTFGRSHPLPAWTVPTHPAGAVCYSGFYFNVNRDVDALSGVTKSGIQFTVDMSGIRTAGSQAEMRIGAGDLVYDQETGNRFFVVSTSGTTITLELLANYTYDSGTDSYSTDVTIPTSTGYLIFVSSRLYTHKHPYTGDIDSASQQISNYSRGDGYAGGSQVQVGDYLVSLATVDAAHRHPPRAWVPGPVKVTAVDPGNATVTVDDTPSRTETQVPLNFWMRAP